MPNPRKIFLPNSLVMVTFRTEEGLPFVPLTFINKIIWSAIARAYELYQVEVCALTIEPNHGHMIIHVTDPEMVSPFIGYIKQETAHAINRLLGRSRKTVWIEGFDSPTILDSHTALEKLAYVLLNPIKDKLVSSMEEYPGVSSYAFLMQDKSSLVTDRIFRDSIVKLQNPEKAWLEEDSYVFENEKSNELEIKFFPYSWKKCFADTSNLTDEEVRLKMLEFLNRKKELFPNLNLNPTRLKRQSLRKRHHSKKFGKRMLCLSAFRDQRQQFINFYKYICEQAVNTLKEWRSGNFILFPPGLFPPCLPRSANFISDVVLN